MTLSIGIQRNTIECRYAECHGYLNVILSVAMLNVVMLRVVAPKILLYRWKSFVKSAPLLVNIYLSEKEWMKQQENVKILLRHSQIFLNIILRSFSMQAVP